MPTSSSISTARALASRRDAPWWIRATSAIWSPTVKTGLSAVIGSWKIMAMRLPRTLRISPSESSERSRPSKRMRLPRSIRPGGRIRRMIESAVTDLPDPDSPTSPTVSPRPIVNETPSTDRATPASE
jgi:hypothetical protein